tara:strand:- start:4084 stop:4875 length:792 start_codon:yes stop_codon:yes gene_type:complete
MTEYDFRAHLYLELKKRQEKNPRYSLRQFAKFLTLEPSFLSKLLRGDRSFTFNQINKLGRKLGLTQQEVDFFKIATIKRIENSSVKNRHKAPKFNKISIDNIALMAGWHFFAILELFSLPHIELTKAQISELFKISEIETENATLHLEKLNLLERNEKNQFSLKAANNTIDQQPFTTQELKLIQRQFLLKSIESLNQDSIDVRDHSGITLAISSTKLPEAKKLIKNFRRRFMSLMQKGDEKDKIYQLAISFYPLSNLIIKEHK